MAFIAEKTNSEFFRFLLVGRLGIGPAWAMAVVIAVTVPITFLSSRFVLKK